MLKCTVPGCPDPCYKRLGPVALPTDLCRKHYRRLERTGFTDDSNTRQYVRSATKSTVCDECSAKVYARDKCKKHYQKMMYKGRASRPKVIRSDSPSLPLTNDLTSLLDKYRSHDPAPRKR